MQQSLKLGGTKDHFKWLKVPANAPYSKTWVGGFREDISIFSHGGPFKHFSTEKTNL
jgi:hypothetical protein